MRLAKQQHDKQNTFTNDVDDVNSLYVEEETFRITGKIVQTQI